VVVIIIAVVMLVIVGAGLGVYFCIQERADHKAEMESKGAVIQSENLAGAKIKAMTNKVKI
jgi:flagellar basal body-associated protein FliL